MPSCASLPPPSDTREPLQRREEFSTKVHKAVQDSVGDRKQNMFYVSGVATAPAKQHRGYASALMRMAADMVRIASASAPPAPPS